MGFAGLAIFVNTAHVTRDHVRPYQRQFQVSGGGLGIDVVASDFVYLLWLAILAITGGAHNCPPLNLSRTSAAQQAKV